MRERNDGPPLSSEWVDHMPDLTHTEKPWIKAEPDCPCGIKERHRHCGVCGKLISIGDWDAPPIAEWIIRV